MDVSVIIVNYNTLRLTANCIDSIFRQTSGITFEVILIDNASTDGSPEFFRSDKRITFIASDTNLGFGRANNLGYTHAKGDFIFLLNSDTIVENNALKIFHDAMSALPDKVACIGCQLLNATGGHSHSFGDYLTFRNSWQSVLQSLFSEEKRIPDDRMPAEGIKVPVIIGADLFIRRKVIEQEGFFDPAFFMYHEENDLQKRYAAAGYECRIVPGPRIVHLEGKSNPHKINILSTQGNFLFIKKWYSYPQYLLYRIIYAATHFPKIFIRRIPRRQRAMYLKTLLFHTVPHQKKS